MKPKNLKFCGINCFDTPQNINFETLASSGVFGIFGPTGSGKTTILDAITLALFGETRRSHGKGDFVNTKSKKASVEFLFESGNDYLVVREYSIKKSGLVESDAKLFENGNLIAEGARAVSEKIYDITGLTCDDFSKCVALPQGEFAAFLKAKPAERTNLVGKLFGLEQYGDDLFRKANAKKEFLSQELVHTNDLLFRLGANLSEEITMLCEEIEEVKQKISNTSKELDDLRAKELVQSANKQKFDRYQELVSEQKEQDQLALSFDEQRKIVATKSKIVANKENITRYSQIQSLLKNAEKELETLKIQYAMLSNQMQDTIRRQKENLKKQETLPNSEGIILDLVKINEKELSAAVTKKEVEQFEAELEEMNNLVETLKIEKDKTERELDKTQKNIEKINIEIENNEKIIENLQVNAAGTTKTQKIVYQQVLDKLQYHFDQIEILNDERMKEIAKRNDLCKKNESKIHHLLNKIDFEDDFEKMQADLVSKIDRMKHAKEHIDMLEGQKELVAHKIGSLDAEIALARAEIDRCEQDKEKLENSRASLKEQLKNLDKERDNALLDNAENTVSSETIVGAECPICGNIVTHIYPPKNSAIANINNAIAILKRQIEHIDNEILQSQIEKSKFLQSIEFFSKQKEEKQKEIKQFDASIQKVLIEFVDLGDNAKEAFVQKLDGLMWKIESFDKIREQIKHLKDHSKILQDQNVIVGNSLVKDQETRELLFDYIQNLQKILAEKELETLSASQDDKLRLEEVSLETKTKKQELATCEKQKLEFLTQLAKIETSLAEKQTKIKELENKIEIKTAEIEETCKLVNENLLGFKSIEDRIEKTRSAKDTIAKEAKELAEELTRISTQFQDEAQKKSKMEQQVSSWQDELLHIERIVVELKKSTGTSSVDGLIKILNEDTKEIEKQIEDFDQKRATTAKLLSEFKEVPQDNFDKSLGQTITQKQAEISKLQTCLGTLVEKEKTKRENLNQSKELEKQKVALEKQYNNFSELGALLRGKELLAFATEEYLQEITSVATEKLFDLLDGRYSLVYKDKDFFVEDHFDDGKLRATSTLSGGETFVVSLALAISIAENILRLTNKKIEFFFLDEGFGTLDQELREVIVSSLLKLKNSGIVIGLITHMQELKNDITSRIIVKRQMLGDGTSKSTLVFEQDI